MSRRHAGLVETTIRRILTAVPSFTCQVCHSPFEVAQAVLDKYPGWQRAGCTRQRSAPALAPARLTAAQTAAHTGNRWNEYADSLATAWMRSTL